MAINKAMRDALVNAGVTRESFKPAAIKQSGKKRSKNAHDYKSDAEVSGKLRKAQKDFSKKRKKPARKTIKKIKSPSYLNGKFLESVYGGVKRAVKNAAEKKIEPKHTITCRVPSPLLRASQFELQNSQPYRILAVSDANEWQSSSRNVTNQNIVMIGLDFGTSSTKVVLQDVAKRAYAVPFTDVAKNPYLLPAKIYETEGVFSLEAGQTTYRDLKLILLQDRVDLMTLVPAVTYLAMVIRHSQGWLWDNHHDTYAKDQIIWGLNLGLPAASYENARLVMRFMTMAIAALKLAGSETEAFHKDIVYEAVKSTDSEISQLKKTGQDLQTAIKARYPVNVFPEIAAQVFGFVRSTSWDSHDRPMMMMVDIGAGTVDASIFTVLQPTRARRTFNFFGNNVRGNGVMNLHRARLRWLRETIKESSQLSEDVEQYFCDIEVPTDRLLPIPERVEDYIPGMTIDLDGCKSIDQSFFGRYSGQLYDDTVLKVKETKVGLSGQWKDLPFFLCGGGRNMEFYKQFVTSINRSNATSISLDLIELPTPPQLEAKGLREREFHRLSVAYGLSFEDIGQFVKPDAIPDISRVEKKQEWTDRYISKDQV